MRNPARHLDVLIGATGGVVAALGLLAFTTGPYRWLNGHPVGLWLSGLSTAWLLACFLIVAQRRTKTTHTHIPNDTAAWYRAAQGETTL